MNEPAPFNPWATIWLNPRDTVRQIVETNPRRSFALLVLGGGLGNAFSYAASFHLADTVSFAEVVVLCLLAGPISGLISLYLWSWLLGLVSRQLGGAASRQELRVAVAWSWAPVAYLLPLWGIRYILFREEIFQAEKTFVEAHALLNGIMNLFGGIDFLITLVSLFILFNAVAEVNRFSIWKSIGAIGLVILAMTIPALVLLRFVAPM